MSVWWTLTNRPIFAHQNLFQNWDVVIIGGGFSGLWTAHHLISADPSLKIAILERDHVGSGASGRNGGWISDLYPISDEKLLRRRPKEDIESLHQYLRKSIDDIGHFIAKNKINCGFVKGGSLSIALNGGQLSRLVQSNGNTLLGRDLTLAKVKMHGALGSEFTSHCASVDPAALLVGLAQSLENSGVDIFENTEATFDGERNVYVGGSRVSTSFVVRATEAYLEGTREQIPIYSLMIATDPLPESIFDEIGIHDHQTFAEASHLVTYGQRSHDNRLVIGGRGAPYSWGSKRHDYMENRKRDHQRLRRMATRWFPNLRETDFVHEWGGAVGVTRDWSPYLRHNNSYGEIGGYVGDGLTLSYLVASTMADVILDQESPRRKLPYVQWHNPKWEPEPLRWLGVNAGIRLASLADREESFTRRPSRLMKLAHPILGH